MGKWSSLYGFDTIFYSILYLLNNPNCNSPLNIYAAKVYSKCEKIHKKNKNIDKDINFKSYIKLCNIDLYKK